MSDVAEIREANSILVDDYHDTIDNVDVQANFDKESFEQHL